MNFLFRNTNQKPIKETIALLCKQYKVDVLILAESGYEKDELLNRLNETCPETRYYERISNCEKMRIYTNFAPEYLTPIWESHRYTIRELTLPGCDKILIMGIHFPDKRNNCGESQAQEASYVAAKIREMEKTHRVARSIIVGDFNMNPFEPPMVSTGGFNATKSSDVALLKSRTVQKKEYLYFYNPMWSLFGDLYSQPPGTYYYNRAEHVNYKWNIFDQVLIRPDLIKAFDKTGLKIITQLENGESLVKKSFIPNEKISDHLPIIFTLNLH